MATPRSINHPYARRGSPVRSRQEDECDLSTGEPQLEVEAVTATVFPQPSRFHVFTDLARAVRTRVSYMWGTFCHIVTPVRDRSLPSERYAPPTPQDTIQGQLNKGWVPLSEHLPRDYDEVLTRDRLRCLETTIAHVLMTHSSSLPNCLSLLQEVENDIRNRVQLTSAQSDTTAWYTVLGTYAILASHINSLAPRSARRGLFPNAPATVTPQPLPPIPSPPPPPSPHTPASTPNAPPSTTLSIPNAAITPSSPVSPSSPPLPTSSPLPLHLPPPPPPPLSPPQIPPTSPNVAPAPSRQTPLAHFSTLPLLPPHQIPLPPTPTSHPQQPSAPLPTPTPPPPTPYPQQPSVPSFTPTPPPPTTPCSRIDQHHMQHLEQEMFRAVPVFDSAYPREFSRWIAQMDQLFTGSGYDISHARSILSIKLSGSARTNVLHNIRHAQSWAEIRATLVCELSDTPDVVDLITAFRQLRQNGGPIQDYNAQFREYLFRTKAITDTDDIDLLQRYCDGLDNEYEPFRTKQIA